MREKMAGCGRMILGSDSHTRYGALGTMAMGEGGGELVKQLLCDTYDIAYPGVVGVYLTGRPRPGSRDYWGRGLMPEAVKAVTAYLFDTVGLDFLLVGHFDWNRQSARVIQKCGFRFIKTCNYKTRYGTVENSEESILYNPKGRRLLTHKGSQTIETPRLLLRRAEISDAEPMYRNWASSPEVTKFLTWPPHASLDVTKQVLSGWIEECVALPGAVIKRKRREL